MKIAIMQPYLFPYIGYFQLINAVDVFVLLDDVNYINKGWINRNRILVNNQEYLFTIPLINASQNKLINEIELYELTSWRSKFIKTLKYNYSKAPFFKETLDLVSEIMSSSEINLSSFIHNSILLTNHYLNINTIIRRTTAIYSNQELKCQDRIIDICKRENTKDYINLSGGLTLYNSQEFARHGLNLSFIKSHSIHYKQLNNYFIPNLSIIDILMFNSKNDVKYFLSRCDIL